MEQNPYQPNKAGIPIFMVGALIGMALFIATFLQDTEAIVFSPLLSGENTLRAFSCPEFLTPQEVGTVRAKIHNPTQKLQYRSVRSHITQGFFTLKRETYDHYYLEPDETKNISWEVYPEDAAYGYLILVKVYYLPQDPTPSYVGACGIMMVDVPLVRGWHLIFFVTTMSFTLMAVGFRRYLGNNPLLRGRKRTLAVNLVVIAVVVVLGLGTMFIESWYIKLFLFIFSVILMAESIFFFSQS